VVRSKEVEVCDSEREERETGGVGKGISSAVIVPKKKLVRHDLPKKRERNRKADQKKKSTECWGYRRATTANTLKKNKRPPSQMPREGSPRLRNVMKSIFVSHS
jgi:hypothetical protein